MVQLCASADETVDAEAFKDIVDKSLKVVSGVYGNDAPAMEDFLRIILEAVGLESDGRADWEIIENDLGGGWVAEETLAIAIFSVLRHMDDFSACMVSAVNHGGDSDSTGAVAGNIIGAITGYEAIPAKFKEGLQLHDLLLSTADALRPETNSVCR